MGMTVAEFANRYCSMEEGAASALERNAKRCFALADAWGGRLDDWLSGEGTILSEGSALEMSNTFVELIKQGNISLTLMTTRPGGRPTLAQCKAVVAQHGYSKINAIKEIRTLTNTGLKEAKDFVEALERGHGQENH